MQKLCFTSSPPLKLRRPDSQCQINSQWNFGIGSFVQPGDAQAQTPALQTWVFGCNSPDFAWEAQKRSASTLARRTGPSRRRRLRSPIGSLPALRSPIMPIVGELEARRVRPGFCAGLRVRRESDGARLMDLNNPGANFQIMVDGNPLLYRDAM